MPTEQILSEEAVQEIESQLDRLLSTLTFGEPAQGNRYVESVDGDYYFEEHADNEFETFDLLRRVPALCQTVRAQAAEREKAIKILSPDIPRTDLCDAARQIVFAHAMEKGSAEKLQSKLSEVTKERDDLRAIVKVATDEDPGLHLSRLHKLQADAIKDFHTRVINLCKEKAVEWQSLFDADATGDHDDKTYYVKAANQLHVVAHFG